MIHGEDEKQRGDGLDLAWEDARFIFWPVTCLGVITGTFYVLSGGVTLYGVGAMFCIQIGWRILSASGVLARRKALARIGPAVLSMCWLGVLVVHARTIGWF